VCSVARAHQIQGCLRPEFLLGKLPGGIPALAAEFAAVIDDSAVRDVLTRFSDTFRDDGMRSQHKARLLAQRLQSTYAVWREADNRSTPLVEFIEHTNCAWFGSILFFKPRVPSCSTCE
jgi:hypothetical protein